MGSTGRESGRGWPISRGRSKRYNFGQPKNRKAYRSSIEAEYMSAANNASKLWWICSLLTKLGITLSAHPVIWCENVSTTFLYANHVFHSRMKLAALDYHSITRQIQNNILNTRDQLAYICINQTYGTQQIHWAMRQDQSVHGPLRLAEHVTDTIVSRWYLTNIFGIYIYYLDLVSSTTYV